MLDFENIDDTALLWLIEQLSFCPLSFYLSLDQIFSRAATLRSSPYRLTVFHYTRITESWRIVSISPVSLTTIEKETLITYIANQLIDLYRISDEETNHSNKKKNRREKRKLHITPSSN